MYMYNAHTHIHIYTHKGRATGSQKLSSVAIVCEKGEWQKAIDGALDLLIRMETDRQETIHKLSKLAY